MLVLESGNNSISFSGNNSVSFSCCWFGIKFTVSNVYNVFKYENIILDTRFEFSVTIYPGNPFSYVTRCTKTEKRSDIGSKNKISETGSWRSNYVSYVFSGGFWPRKKLFQSVFMIFSYIFWSFEYEKSGKMSKNQVKWPV